MPSLDASDIDQASLLSDATLTALQLNRQPFGPIAPDRVSFSDETSAEQLADVKQALITGDDLLLILGEHGAGKSVLLDQLGTNSGLRIQCFAVKGSPRFSTLNLFAGMLEAFKRKPPEKLKEILDDLIPCLQTMVARNTLSAIVLDDAHQVNESELTQLLSGMLYVNSQDETLMRVALAAPPEFEDRIPDLLPEGADLPYSSLTIDGMSPPRAADYLGFRLHEAGYTGELPFTERDMGELVDQSGGFPTGLHIAVADALNQQYGPLEQVMPAELMNETRGSILQTRLGKLGLGALATLLIVGGVVMFLPDAADKEDRYTVANQNNTQDTSASSPKLRLVEEQKVVPLSETNGADATNSGTNATPSANLPIADNNDRSSPTDSGSNGSAAAVDGSTRGATAQDSSAGDSTAGVSAANDSTAGDSTASDSSAGDSTASDSTAGDADQSSTETTADGAAADTNRPNGARTTGNTAATDGASAADDPATSESDAATDPTDNSIDSSSTASLPTDIVESGSADEPSGAGGTDSPFNADIPAATVPSADSGSPDVDPELADVLESPTWILVQDPALITVQMSASRDRPSIENFLKRNRDALPPPNSIYTFQREGETWYALLHGLFPTFDAAKAAVQQMPNSALTNQPWIRNVGRIQSVLKAQ